MTREEFEKHLDQIVKDTEKIVRYNDEAQIIASHVKSILFHREELTKFYDRHAEEEE